MNAAVLVYPTSGVNRCQAVLDAAAQQAGALERTLPRGWRIIATMAQESTVAEAIRAAASGDPKRLVVVSMDPWHEGLREMCEAVSGESELEYRELWWDESSLVDLNARSIRHCALLRGLSPRNTRVVLRAMGRDAAELEPAAELLAARLGWPRRRLELAAGEEGADIAEPGVLVHDLDVAPVREQRPCGGSMACPHKMLSVLSSLVRRGRYPMAKSPPALFTWAGERQGASLSAHMVMVGVSVRGALGRGDGPALRYCDAETFRSLKRPHGEILEVLQSLRSGTFREALVWNTCNRMELYGWVDGESHCGAAQAAVDEAARALFGDAAAEVNVLRGAEALQHLLRTAAGLNSALAGDAEVLDQLESARRTAEHAGTAGNRTHALLHEVAEVTGEVRNQTGWGQFSHRYCEVALERMRPQLRRAIEGRCMVIGGSTTAASVLETLATMGAGPANLTLIYRGQRSGALTRRLNAAVEGGRIVNVESYGDPAVMDEIVEADAVFLAGDHREPVVRAPELSCRRDVAAHPLLVVDFNTLGSTEGLERLEGVRLVRAEQLDAQVEAFNDEVKAQGRFRSALKEAEACIARHSWGPRRGESGCPAAAGGKDASAGMLWSSAAQKWQGAVTARQEISL